MYEPVPTEQEAAHLRAGLAAATSKVSCDHEGSLGRAIIRAPLASRSDPSEVSRRLVSKHYRPKACIPRCGPNSSQRGAAGFLARPAIELLIFVFMMLLARKTSTRRGVIGTSWPVFGLRPTR